MKKLILIIFVLIFSSGFCDAQKLVKAFNALQNGDTAYAQKRFKKFIKKKKEIYAAFYGTGLCQIKTEPRQALINFKKTEGKFRNSGKIFKKYMLDNYHITCDSVMLKINSIAASELRRTIEQDSTETAFEAYIRTFRGCCDKKFITRALKLQEETAYRAARKDTTLKKARAFLKKYPESSKQSFLTEFIDSVEYYSALRNGTKNTLKKFIEKHQVGHRYLEQAYKMFDYLSFPTPEGIVYLTDEYLDNWRREVYYSGHFERLKFFHDRVPHLMNDSLKRMYYAGLYGEVNFETIKYRNNSNFLAKRDSVYDYYIQRAAPSKYAFKKMQELYADFVFRGSLDSANAVLDKYAPLFPNFEEEIKWIRLLINGRTDYCKPVKLPSAINNEPYFKPVVKYVTVSGKKYPSLENKYMFKDGANKFPVISPDGSKIYFTHWIYQPVKLKWSEHKEWKKTKTTWDTSGVRIDTVCVGANIFVSERKNGKWLEPVPVPGLSTRDSIMITTDTTKYNDKISGYSFFRCYQKIVKRDNNRIMMGGISNDGTMITVNAPKKLQYGPPDDNGRIVYLQAGTLCYSHLGNSKWTPPALAGDINSYIGSFANTSPHPFFGSFDAHISPRGDVIIYAASRKGVQAWREGLTMDLQQPYPDFFVPDWIPGNERYYPDLYYSVKDKDGNWSYPATMGFTLNTEYSEMSPVLAADNKTLYFVSEGHYGMGGTDIYMCKRTKEDKWNEWTAPINLGKYINTPYNEYNFSITADGRTACFASEEPVTHRLVYYTVELPKSLRPDTIAIYKGVITDLEGTGKSARIRVEDLNNNCVYAVYHTQMPSGGFYFGLPQDRSYKFTITAKNCVTSTDTLNFKTPMPVVKTHNFVLPDSVCVFEKRLTVKLKDDEEVRHFASFLAKYDFPFVEITVSAPSKRNAEERAESTALKFSAAGIDKEKIKITTLTGKDEIFARIIDEK